MLIGNRSSGGQAAASGPFADRMSGWGRSCRCGFEDDLVAEGLELADEVAGLPGGVEMALVPGRGPRHRPLPVGLRPRLLRRPRAGQARRAGRRVRADVRGTGSRTSPHCADGSRAPCSTSTTRPARARRAGSYGPGSGVRVHRRPEPQTRRPRRRASPRPTPTSTPRNTGREGGSRASGCPGTSPPTPVPVGGSRATSSFRAVRRLDPAPPCRPPARPRRHGRGAGLLPARVCWFPCG